MGIIRKRPSTAATSLWTIFETHRTDGIFISIILFISVAVYLNSLFNGFVLDDTIQVLQNTLIKDIKNIPEIFTKGIVYSKENYFVSNYYRPMMNILYMFNYHIFGLKPWGFHLINILMHAGVSVLVFLIIKVLLRGPSQSPGAFPPAFMAALLFVTHPIHTEAVAWVAGVPELSYTLFFLLALYLYMKSKEGFNRGYLFSVVSFALATLCKETALTLPIILITYDYVYRREGDSLPDYIKRYMPFFIVSACYLLIRYYALGGFAPRKPNIESASYVYFINMFPLFGQYLEKLLLPINLNAMYVIHPIFSIFEMRGVVSVAITTAFVVFSVIALKKRKTASLGFFILAVPLLPALYLYPSLGIFVFAERYLYLSSFGFIILIALVLSWATINKPKVGFALNIITILIIGLYSIGTITRNAVWKNEYKLYSDTVKKSPDSFVVRNNLGLLYAEQGQIDAAINEFQTAIILEPNDAEVHFNLGVAYISLGRSDEAINEFKTALKLKPDYDEARQMLEFSLKK